MSMRQRAGGKPSDSKRRRADSCSRAGTTRFHPGPGKYSGRCRRTGVLSLAGIRSLISPCWAAATRAGCA